MQLATKPAFHLVIKSSLNPTEIPLNLTDNPPNLTETARNQTERIAVSNAARIAKLMASKLLGSKEKDLLKLLNPPNININFLVRLLLGHPGNVPGTNRACPRDKVGLSQGQTQVFFLFYTAEAQFVPGTFRGRRAADRVYVLKVYVPSSFPIFGRGAKTPTPKTRFSIWTLLRTPSRFTTRPLPVHFTTKMSVVRPFSVLSKDEIGL